MRTVITEIDAELHDADQFTSFSASLPAALAAGPLSGPWGSFDGEYAWVSISWLRSQAPGRESEAAAWLAQLDHMIAFAGSRGWLSEDQGAVRAHIE